VPVVASAHSFQFQLHWPFNSHVIANSDATARFMQRVNRVPANRISTVRCFIDLPKFRATPESYRSYYRVELHVRDEDFLVGVIGDVNPNKGQEYLIEAIPRMLKTIPRLKIAFIGRFHRNERHVQRLRRKLIEDQSFRRVKWLGIRENIHQYLKAFDVLCVPSLEESLGLVAAEGQAAGIPVIATDVGGLGEVVQNEQTGLMIPPRNSAAIAEAVIRLYRDRSLGELLAANAKAAVERNFDPETLTSQVESVYEQVLGRQQRAVA
jgi:glycosyltransferase involved in cell wall biosynthesis